MIKEWGIAGVFETWKEFKVQTKQDKPGQNCCASCGLEDFDLLCKEKDDADNSLTAIFVCKSCGIQKKMPYTETEK